MTEPADPTVWAATSPAAPAPASRATPAAGTATAATAATAARVTRVTGAGADWLASASRFPRSVHALWALRPGAPSVLPCGTAFDVVSTPVLYGRRLLDRLWSAGPGSGPAALHRGRVLVFTAPGCADRLPALLRWEEWRRRGPAGHARPDEETSPPLLCHGLGDTVTIPPLLPDPASPAPATHWLVAPAVRQPWLPGAEMLLWAHIRMERDSRAGRDGEGGGKRIFAPQDRDAKVYDVSRRR